MDIDLAALPDDVETLQRMVRSLATERTSLSEAQAEIERLRLIVQKLQRSQFGRRAERLDDDQLQLGFEDLGADIARVEAILPSTTANAPAVKPQTERPSLPAHLPREDRRLDIEHQACPCCGGPLHAIGETVSETLDYVPARLRVSWNDKLLAEQLQSLATLDLEFSLDITGFELPEIDFRIGSLTAGTETDQPHDPTDEIPSPPGGSPVTKPGDLWILGRHRFLCGNALEGTAYDRLMGNEKAGMVFTDPPYNVRIPGHVSGKGAVKHRDFAMASGEQSPAEFTRFLASVSGHLRQYTVPGAVIFQCMDWRHVREILDAADASKFEHLNTCVWYKHNAGMGSLYRSQHEFVFVFKNGKARHKNNVQLGRYGRNRSNVWEYRGRVHSAALRKAISCPFIRRSSPWP